MFAEGMEVTIVTGPDQHRDEKIKYASKGFLLFLFFHLSYQCVQKEFYSLFHLRSSR